MNDAEAERLSAGGTGVPEQARNEQPPVRAARARPARSVVYSIRLTAEQADEIQRMAAAAGIPAVGLVRGWVMERLAAEQESPAELGCYRRAAATWQPPVSGRRRRRL